jgi:hypothetical protein
VQTRPRVPPALARRIDRLARIAHRAHRYAHHPLCRAYAGELVRLGSRVRVCRGCMLVSCGALAGAVIASAWPLAQGERAFDPRAWLLLVVGVALAAPAVSDAWRTRERVAAQRAGVQHGARKWLTRFAPAAVLAAAVALGVRRADPAGIALVAISVTAAVAIWLGYRRRGPDRSPCVRCPEGPPHAGCSGFAPIVRRERAFQRLASRLLARQHQ